MSSKLANDTNIIYVVGYPKSGNTWLARLLGDVLDSPVNSSVDGSKNALADEGLHRQGGYVVRQKHLYIHPPEGKVVYVFRDPRDVMASAMFYWERPSLEEMIKPTIGAMKLKPLDPLIGWSRMMDTWYDACDARVSYEYLNEDTFGALDSVLLQLGIRAELEDIGRAVRQQAFDIKRKEIKNAPADAFSYGRTIQLKNLRKGIVGDWRNHFNEKCGKLCHESFWPWMNRLQYEDDPEWYTKLE